MRVFLRPHPPIIAPEPYNTMYDPAKVPMPQAGGTLAGPRKPTSIPISPMQLKGTREVNGYNEHYPYCLAGDGRDAKFGRCAPPITA